MLRRRFLLSPLAAPSLFGGSRIDLSRLSLLTDEVGKTHAEAVAFARQYGIGWLELRRVPGESRTYAYMEEPKLRELAADLKANGLKVSFLNTPMLKFQLPGTEPARGRTETPEQKTKREEREKQQFDNRLADLRKVIRAAHILGVRDIRVFTFTRVAEPESVFPRVAQVLDEMAAIASKEGIRLLVENEGSCNVATSAELKRICELVPRKGFGINWDPVNGMSREKPFPDGYALLPKKRIGNVQMKARALVIGPDFLDWPAILQALARDGYKGKVGLETHVFDGTLIEKSHLCLKKLREIMG
ncbi:MAG: sugar phosphate isomerase/epimerase [Candidatus Solibacter usitatus]|nr:sugar phosphate isomerase/epimerase [Candidatus Solibacter usitatus]